MLASLVACAPSPSLRSAEPPRAETIDLASDFVATACNAPPGDDFARAWLAHEDRNWGLYSALYYRDAASRAERAQLAQELGPRRDEMCGHTRAFLAAAPQVLSAMRPRVAALMGRAPVNAVAFTAALQWTDGNVRAVDGREVLALNARHETFAQPDGLTGTIAHELIHDAQEALYGDSDDILSPVALTLFREGAAVFGVLTIFPQLGDRATNMKPADIDTARSVLPRAAADLLAGIRASDRQAVRRFFQGGVVDAVYPPRTGYLVALDVYRALGAARGAENALRIAPAEFRSAVEVELDRLSRTSPPATGSPASARAP